MPPYTGEKFKTFSSPKKLFDNFQKGRLRFGLVWFGFMDSRFIYIYIYIYIYRKVNMDLNPTVWRKQKNRIIEIGEFTVM